MAGPKLHLSPSDFHRHLMDSITPALTFKGGNVKAWQKKTRAKVAELVGGIAAKRVPLKVRSLWKRDHALGSIEKIAFTAEPHADVLAYVCIPKNAAPPYAWAICLQGHSTGMHVSIGVDGESETRAIEVGGDLDCALGCMKRGIAAIAVEQRSFGYRREQAQRNVSPQGCHDATMQALMLGRTLLGERVFDVDRAVDYLMTRDDVNPARIGVTGNSGGGTISLFSAALLPRIRWAMPSCYFCTFRDSVMSIYHCADNYVPNLLLWAEMPDVMGLFAPKPVTIVAGKVDPIFPIAGVRRAFKHLRRIYAAAGAKDACRLVVGPDGHRFYADLAWPTMLEQIERL